MMRLPKSMATAGWRFQDRERKDGAFGIYFTLNQRENHDIQSIAPQSMPKIIKQMFADSGYSDEKIAFYIFHQPARILVQAWANNMGFLKERYGSCVENFGCLSSVSMPFVFFKPLEQGKIKPGDPVVFASPGVGWSFGAQIWRVGQVRVG